jgi:hypothetical protein
MVSVEWRTLRGASVRSTESVMGAVWAAAAVAAQSVAVITEAASRERMEKG